jgi:ubiquinone/menaquinone biosynthesis C-methylase UbiE
MEELLKPVIESLEEEIIGKRVLEIACGTGNWTQVLAKRADLVVAIDSSPTALEIAEKKLSSYNNVILAQCDAYSISRIDGVFDVCFAADWWSHIPLGAIPHFVRSIIAKMKPESTAVFLDMTYRDVFGKETCYYDSDRNRVSRRRNPDGLEFDVVKNFPTETELRQTLDAYASTIEYHKFDALKRWMLVFSPKK